MSIWDCGLVKHTFLSARASLCISLADSYLLVQEEALEQASLAMKKGMRRVNRALQQSKSNHFLYLALFCLAIFFALYLWARIYRFVKKVH